MNDTEGMTMTEALALFARVAPLAMFEIVEEEIAQEELS